MLSANDGLLYGDIIVTSTIGKNTQCAKLKCIRNESYVNFSTLVHNP